MKRRTLLGAAGFAALPLPAAAKLANTTLHTGDAKVIREPFGEHRIYFDGPTDQLKSMTAGSLRLSAGASPHPPHEHPEEEFLLITEGSGEVSVGGQVTKVGPGSMMYCAGGKTHGIVNTGKTPLFFYYYKWAGK